MALTIHPKAGMVVVCDFAGYKEPEIIKIRPVVIISPNHLPRYGLCTVVPLSTTAPSPVQPYHYKLIGSPFPHDPSDVWAKCDLVASVSVDRLDRIRISRGNYNVFYVSMEQVRKIRICAAISLGVDVNTE